MSEIVPKAGRTAKAILLGEEICEVASEHDGLEVEEGWWVCSCGTEIQPDDGGYEPEEDHMKHRYLAVGWRMMRIAKRLAREAEVA